MLIVKTCCTETNRQRAKSKKSISIDINDKFEQYAKVLEEKNICWYISTDM